MVEAEEEYLEQLEVKKKPFIRRHFRNVKLPFDFSTSAGAGVVLSTSVQDGRVLETTAVLARGRQLHLPQLRNGVVSASDLP